MRDINVQYVALEGHYSHAYVSEDPPHAGVDKHTGIDMTVAWNEGLQRWEEV